MKELPLMAASVVPRFEKKGGVILRNAKKRRFYLPNFAWKAATPAS
jgi:hypothetical protein